MEQEEAFHLLQISHPSDLHLQQQNQREQILLEQYSFVVVVAAARGDQCRGIDGAYSEKKIKNQSECSDNDNSKK